MPIDALSVLCAQLTRDLLTIAKFLFSNLANRQTDRHRGQSYIPPPLSEVNYLFYEAVRRTVYLNLSLAVC